MGQHQKLGTGLSATAQAGFFFSNQKSPFQLAGVAGPARTNVENYLLPLEAEWKLHPDLSEYRIQDAVKKALAPVGYFEPTMTITPLDKGKQGFEIDIKPGKPVRLVACDVTFDGTDEAKTFFESALLQKPPLRSILNQGVYTRYKEQLNSIALENGFFGAHFSQHELAVNLPLHEAKWLLTFVPGTQAHFGRVTFEGSQIRTEVLDAMVPFQEGEPFQAAQMNQFTRDLINSGWFQNVAVEPVIGEAPVHTVPITVQVTPKKPNAIELGLGFRSDDGPYASVSWHKPYINSWGHKLNVDAAVAPRQQALDIVYKMPRKHAPTTDYYMGTVGFQHQEIQGNETHFVTLGASQFRLLPSEWSRQFGVNYRFDRYQENNQTKHAHLLMPFGALGKVSSDGELFPKEGSSQRYAITFSVKHAISRVSFFKAEMQHAYLTTFDDTYRLIVRDHVGAIVTPDITKVPLGLRFFAGGEQSIRGYPYQAVSPISRDGDKTGGKFMLTTSLELQRKIQPNWWAATFVDAGDVVNRFQDWKTHVGAGVGIRWVSPVGPIRLDVAVPLTQKPSTSRRNFEFYLGLGAVL